MTAASMADVCGMNQRDFLEGLSGVSLPPKLTLTRAVRACGSPRGPRDGQGKSATHAEKQGSALRISKCRAFASL